MIGQLVEENALAVSGFEPFDGRAVNRSWEVVRRVPPQLGVQTLQLPVDFARLKLLVPRLMSHRPRVLLLLGEARCQQVQVEQLALNIMDSEREDNAGVAPLHDPVVAGGPLALAVPWDANAVAHELRLNGIAAGASFHAGTFACNTALYLALHACRASTAVGFLHVPQRAWPLGMKLDLLIRAVVIGLEALQAPAGRQARQARSPAER